MIVVLLTLVSYFAPLLRETNSHAAQRRASEQYAKEQYPSAAESFAKAHELRPSTQSAFNLGTAQIAAGKHALGSATLEPAMTDRGLVVDALYNRGNSALAAGAFEHAVRDYTNALKFRPGDRRAQRNLEIALRRQKEAQRPGAGGQQDQKGAAKNQQKTPSSGGKQQEEQPKGNADLEALLRSVQQQEQEERQRMKQAGQVQERVGW